MPTATTPEGSLKIAPRGQHRVLGVRAALLTGFPIALDSILLFWTDRLGVAALEPFGVPVAIRFPSGRERSPPAPGTTTTAPHRSRFTRGRALLLRPTLPAANERSSVVRTVRRPPPIFYRTEPPDGLRPKPPPHPGPRRERPRPAIVPTDRSSRDRRPNCLAAGVTPKENGSFRVARP
jgi:hypothetical protein